MIVILRGPQGCGKSSLAKEFESGAVLSSDAFRVMYGGNMADQRVSGRVFELIEEIADARVSRGAPVVIDATNTSVKSINPFMKMSRKYGVPLHIIDFQMYDVDELMENIKKRSFDEFGLYVPRAVVERTVSKLVKNSDAVGALVPEDCFHVIEDHGAINDLLQNNEFEPLLSMAPKQIVVDKDNFWSIGDIHGCLNTYTALIDQLVERGAKDVVLLGDYVDRGPNSIGVLAKIQRQIAKTDGNDFNLYAIRGNHDDRLYRELKFGSRCRSISRAETHRQIKEQGVESLVIDVIEPMPPAYLFFTDDMSDGVLATHGGLDAGASIGGKVTYQTACSPSREMSDDEKAMFVSDELKQVHGHRHWEFKEDINPFFANIDGGAVYGDFLIAYNVFTKQVVKQPLIDEVKTEDGESENE